MGRMGRRPRHAYRVRCRALIVAALVALVLASATTAGDEGAVYRGRPLLEVLNELRDEGLDLVFSSAVVSDKVVVTVEPTAGDPRAVLEQILAPLRLALAEGPGGSLLVVPLRDEDAGDDAGETVVPHPVFSEKIIVTPGRHALLHEEQTAARVIDPADSLRVPNIGNDISRMVDRLPGIAAGDNTAAFHARGSRALDTSLVLDDLELYEPYHLLSFQAPFSLIDARVADRVELLNGGFTADRGDRHGAFLDIATVTPQESPRGEVEVGTLNSRLSYVAPVAGGQGAGLGSLRAWYPEAFLDTIELGAGERLHPRFGDAYGKFSWSASPRTLVSAHALFSVDRLSWEETGEPDNEKVDANTDSGYLWARLMGVWRSDVTTTTVVSGGRIERTRRGVASPDTGQVILDDRRKVSFYGLTHDLDWRVSPIHLVRGGLYVRQLDSDYRYTADFENDPGASRSVILDPSGTSLGLYVAHRARISDGVSTELGVRWDRQDHTEDEQLDPRFNLVWRTGKRGDLRVAIGRFSQSQRIHELQVEDGETAYSSSETARSVELTFRRELPAALRLRVDAYYRELTDVRPRYENLYQPLDLFPETSEDRVMIAPDEARLRGIELLLSGDPAGPLSWWASYTWSTAEDRIDGDLVPRSWDQPHALKFLVGYEWNDRWNVSLAGTGHTGWPTTPATAVIDPDDGSIGIEPILSARNSDRLPDYARLDLKVRRSFAMARSRLSLTLDVINLTDRENVCCVDDFVVDAGGDGSPRARPEYSFWLGFTPSLQVRWQF
jgi:hypothetical protein